MRNAICFLSTGLVLMVASAVFAGGGTLHSGNASFQLIGGPTGVWDSNLGNGWLYTDSSPLVDQLYQYTWYIRCPNNNQNRYFSFFGPTPTETWVGDTATITYTNAGPGVAGQPWSERFDATFTLKLIDGPSPNQVRGICSLLLHNPNPATVTYQLFNVVDLDLSATATDDTVQITSTGETRGKYTESGSGGNYAEALGVGATKYQADYASTIRGYFNGGSYNLTNNAGPYTGDGSIAFQWTVTLAPGASTTIRSGFSINQTAVAEVPCVPADANCSGGVTIADVQPFVSLLLGASAPCASCTGDLNGDLVVDGRDIQGFVDELLPP